MQLSASISTIMTKDVHTIDVSQSLYDVQEVFETKNVRHIPVLKESKLAGIISKTDLKRLSFGQAVGDGDRDVAIFDMLSIDQVMNDKVHTVSPNATIEEVATQLAKEEYHALPVAENGELKGIVSTTDMIQFLLDNRA